MLQKEVRTVEAWGIPNQELLQRVERVRSEMGSLGLDLLIIYSNSSQISNVAYLTQSRGVYRSPGKLIALPLEGDATLFCRSGEVPLDRVQSWVEDVRPFNELEAGLKEIVQRTRPERVGIERNYVPVDILMPHSIYEQVIRACNGVNFTYTDIVSRMKQVKSPAELELMRAVGRIVDLGQDAVREAISIGTSEIEVVAAGAAAMSAAGATFATDMHMGSGPESTLFHKKPGTRRLQNGDLCYIDIAPRYFGYCADICRTFALGKVDQRTLEVLKIAGEACLESISQAVPGIRVNDLDKKIRAVIERAGYGETKREHLGHGIGLDCSEPPTLSPGDHWELQENMTLSLSAKIIAEDLGAGVLLENNVIVTPTGGELLHHFRIEDLVIS